MTRTPLKYFFIRIKINIRNENCQGRGVRGEKK